MRRLKFAWVNFRIAVWHRECAIEFCETKRRLYFSLFEPLGYVEELPHAPDPR